MILLNTKTPLSTVFTSHPIPRQGFNQGSKHTQPGTLRYPADRTTHTHTRRAGHTILSHQKRINSLSPYEVIPRQGSVYPPPKTLRTPPRPLLLCRYYHSDLIAQLTRHRSCQPDRPNRLKPAPISISPPTFPCCHFFFPSLICQGVERSRSRVAGGVCACLFVSVSLCT